MKNQPDTPDLQMTRVVVIGGGTGTFTVLQGLRKYDLDLGAIISMADDGGSTGTLRDELGVLPPGDVRQCLLALSNSSNLLRHLMNYRFENGGLEGHSFGNLLLSALEKVTGSFEQAVHEAGRMLAIQGSVIPVTTHQVRLKMLLNDGAVLDGEGQVYTSRAIDQGYSKIYLEPAAQVNPRVVEAIMSADLVVLGPGGLYTSLVPSLLVEGLASALCATTARKVFVSNLMNKKGQTTGFKIKDYLLELERFIGRDIFDFVLVNEQAPRPAILERYSQEAELVENDAENDDRVIGARLLSQQTVEYSHSDVLADHRAFIRHDPDRLAAHLMQIVDNAPSWSSRQSRPALAAAALS